MDLLLDNPYQPRVQMRDETLNELAQVIGGQGFQGVLVARPHPERKGYFQLAAGHRRREAARRAGLTALPVVVRELADEELVTIAITENIQRDDLTPLEEGRIYLLMNTEMGYKLEQIAREVGKTVGYIYNRVRVAKAPPDVQALVQEKPDSLRAVANLIKVKQQEDRAEIISQLLSGVLTTDDLPVYIENLNTSEDQPSADHYDTIPLLQAQASEEVPIQESGIGNRESGLSNRLSTPSTVLVNGVEMVVEKATVPVPPFDGGLPGTGIPTPDHEDREALAKIRARRSKLSRMLAMLQAFSDQLEDDTVLSREERLELATIAVLADRMCERFDIGKEI